MYEKCLKCDHLGHDCFPNLYIMSVEDMRDFAVKLKKERRLSNAKIAKISGVSKGTIDSSFANKDADIHYTTFAPILCALLGSNWEESPCPENIADEFRNKETIETLERENEELKERLQNGAKKRAEEAQYLKKEIKIKTIAIITLGVLLFLSLSVLIIALIIDRVDSGLGFLWIDKTLSFYADNTSSGISSLTML